jgi:GT2 family glycosyltransferase
MDSKTNEKCDPFIAIVILNWNGWQDTLNCLESLKNLLNPTHQVIVVDNASTDDSLQRLQASASSVMVLENQVNAGFGAGNNVGIRSAMESGADFVWLLNNDTRVEPDTLQSMLDVVLSDLNIGAVGCVLRYMDQPDRIQAWGGGQVNFFLGSSKHHLGPVSPNKLHYLTAASVLISREAFKAVGGFDGGFFMYWEDVDLSFRIRQAGFKLMVADSAVVFHKESASTGKNLVRRDELFNFSSARLIRRYSRFPLISVGLSLAKRILIRVMRGDWARVRAVLKGTREGWCSSLELMVPPSDFR